MQKAIHGITVSHFFETYRKKLLLETVTGDAGLHRLIHAETRAGEFTRQAPAVLQRHTRALCQIRTHRVRCVTHQRNACRTHQRCAAQGRSRQAVR